MQGAGTMLRISSPARSAGCPGARVTAQSPLECCSTIMCAASLPAAIAVPPAGV